MDALLTGWESKLGPLTGVAAPAVFTVRFAVMISLPGPVTDGVSTSSVSCV